MAAHDESVLYKTTTEGVTTITINRPNRRNAVDGPTSIKLFEAFNKFEADSSQKICVFTGANDFFCAGADLHDLANSKRDQHSNAATLASGHGRLGQHVEGRNRGPMGPSRMQITKPVIAAVGGYAVAGGLELSLIADMRVVEEDAVFGVFCRRWGVPLIDGGTVRLQKVVGLGRALDMILTGRPVGADEALQFGLANRIVPKGKAVEVATQIARDLLKFPQECMLKDRENCYYSAYGAASFEDALKREFCEGIKVVDSESIAGAAKFSSGQGRHGSFKSSSKL